MDEQELVRQEALKRLKARRDFRTHVVVYLVVNAGLVLIWAVTGRGYFWPIWPMAGWAIGLILHGWTAFFERPISEADIEREIQRGR